MARHLHILESGEYCWSKIGVFSREAPSCPLLPRVIHCQNCEVYSTAGRTLFERQAPTDYADEWTSALRLGKQADEIEALSLLVFRIGTEWLALPTTALRQVSDVRPIHALPHRSDAMLLGVVNVRGQIRLCCSLATLLGIEQRPDDPRNASSLAYPRMIVAEGAADHWVFPVDEIDGVRRFRRRHLRDVPATVGKDRAHVTRAVVEFGEDVLLASERGEGALPFQARQVGYLDHERLFEALRQRVFRDGAGAPREGG